mmetsp:Transcript_1467/g.2923  ORF Transcript_1467/g.2923 Transcript_1467/m.2923 type:complete len:95 (+) Transcript_1467:1468-1752(+)
MNIKLHTQDVHSLVFKCFSKKVLYFQQTMIDSLVQKPPLPSCASARTNTYRYRFFGAANNKRNNCFLQQQQRRSLQLEKTRKGQLLLWNVNKVL